MFFLEPHPFEGDKPAYILLLSLIVLLIYTGDHIADGYKAKGNSGVLRYDFNYRHRNILIPMSILIMVAVCWMIYKYRDSRFIHNGVWIGPFLLIYFYFKMTGKLKPILKMIIISIIVTAVVVSLYNSDSVIADLFTIESLSMALLAFLNQLVLEHFEFHEEHKDLQPVAEDLYFSLAKRVFVWQTIILVFGFLLNYSSWPYVLTIFLVSLFLRLILLFQGWFTERRRYRYWADFTFILMWPLLHLFLQI